MRYVLLFLSLTACAHNSSETKSPLNHLNGENYTTSPQGPNLVGPIPVGLSKKGKLSSISGTLLVKSGFIYSPINHEQLILINKRTNKRAEVTTQAGGQFKFSGLFNNGLYELAIQSVKYKGSTSFEVKSYETNGLKLIVTPK